MTWLDLLWEFIDNALFLAHCVLVVALLAFCVATPGLLWLTLEEVRAIRDELPLGCDCRRCDDDGPGPILPRVLPRLRNLREEGGE